MVMNRSLINYILGDKKLVFKRLYIRWNALKLKITGAQIEKNSSILFKSYIIGMLLKDW